MQNDNANLLLEQDPLLKQSVEALGLPEQLSIGVPDSLIKKAAAITAVAGVTLSLGYSLENQNEVLADHEQVCVQVDPEGDCIIWLPLPHDTPTPTTPPSSGGGSGSDSSSGGGNNTPSNPVPTTIPYSERDNDDDGVRNGVDNCDNVVNPDQANFDGDVDGDACDNDIDNDGILNQDDVNNFSSDNDNDGLHDAFDPDPTNPDIDGDGFLDGDPSELEPSTNPDGLQRLWYSRTDTDGDGYSAETGDIDETNTCIPGVNSAKCDQDNDGLTNAEEEEIGTDPKVADTDGDKINDGDDKEPLSEAEVKVDENGVAITTTTSTTTTEPEVLVETTDSDSSAETTELSEENSVTTEPEFEALIDNDSEDDENNNVIWWSTGGTLAGLGVLAGAFALARRKKKETEEDTGFAGTDTSPVAGN